MSEIIAGRNAVLEALKSGREIEKINIQKTGDGEHPSGSIKQIIAKAKEAKIPVYHSDKAFMDKLLDGAKVNCQGVIATASDFSYCSVEYMLALAEERGEKPFIIILDGLEDPHNLGAIMRTAECAGAHGLIIPKRRSVGLTAVVAKTSAGALEYLPVARVSNIVNTIRELKERGLWIYGTAADADSSLYRTNLTGPAAIVIGNEGEGMSRLVRESCDVLVSIPMKGKISSLNASAAAAVMLYEALRQRQERSAD